MKTKHYVHIVLKVIFSLLIITPILGVTGLFPAPTADMYTNPAAFSFIQAMMGSYVVYGIALSCLLSAVLLWSDRTLAAMLIILPITANIIGFHATLDGGLLTGGAIMGNILLILNVYFLYTERRKLQTLFEK
jgi:hypothetical protein